MELAKLPNRLSGLLATLACLWALFRRLRPAQPKAAEDWQAEAPAPQEVKEAPAAAEEANAEPMATSKKEEPSLVVAEAAEVPPASPSAPEPEPAPEAGPADAGAHAPAAAAAPALAAAKEAAAPTAAAPAATPPEPLPESEAVGIPENSKLADRVRVVVELHNRVHESLDVRSAVQTSFVPSGAPEPKTASSELAFPRTQVLAILGAAEALGVLFLAVALALGAGAGWGLAVMCVLVGIAAAALLSAPDARPADSGSKSRPADAVCACAAVQHKAARAVWKSVAAWAKSAPAGVQRTVAWRSGVAFLVEAASSDSAEFTAFVLETNPVIVRHYVAGPGTTSSGAPKAAWGLRKFLGGDEVIASDVPVNQCLGHASVAPRQYKTVKVVTSIKDSPQQMMESGPLELKEGAGMSQDACLFVDPRSRMPKTWLGFGGSFTEASAVVFDKMTPEHQEEVLQHYYNPNTGAGFTIGRISMGSCDFGLGNWACGDLKPEDHELKDFSIAHYHEKILPLYKRAEKIAGTPLWMLASPWSPPPWMKTKNIWNGDAHLRPDCGQVWATHFVKFVQEMAKAGVRIMAVTIQNEPEAAQRWESCIYTGEEERDFVRDHLGPTLWKAGMSNVKVLIWDHNRDGMFERAQIAYADPEAAKYIWGCAYHWYGDCRYENWPDRHEVHYFDRQRGFSDTMELRGRLGLENLRRVAELAPEKHIVFTEGCQELGEVPLEHIQHVWKFGERYAMNIIADMNNGVEGWIDWNLFLNERGGPNHVENNCLAPIIYNTEEKKVILTPPFYALSHFSRYIRPGARRVLCSTSRDVLEITAWANTDDSIAVVVLNQSPGHIDFKLKVAGSGTEPVLAVPVQSPPMSLMTLVIE